MLTFPLSPPIALGRLPPMSAKFLSEVQATYGGQVMTETNGLCETWIFTTPMTGDTIFTFYFDTASNLVRFTFFNLHDPVQR